MSIETFTAKAQLLLSVVFFIGYFACVILFMLGYSRIPDGMREMFTGLVSLMSAGGLMIVQFWFNRSRLINSPPEAPRA